MGSDHVAIADEQPLPEERGFVALRTRMRTPAEEAQTPVLFPHPGATERGTVDGLRIFLAAPDL